MKVLLHTVSHTYKQDGEVITENVNKLIVDGVTKLESSNDFFPSDVLDAVGIKHSFHTEIK